ncbi:MAG TPA: carotenoid biosynthesis protein [Ktedonobacteraceae bacterium]|nr:carotenoid biosynthesis protein [Ktedonobacteraceae bacterium]
MKVLQILFIGYLAILVFCLGGLLLVSPSLAFWHLNITGLATFQLLLQWAAELQIVFGAAIMLLFGFLFVGPVKTSVFFVISLLGSFLMRALFTDKTSLLGIYPANIAPARQESGLEVFLILLSWFFISFSSYVLACKLVVRLGLRQQTLWALLLGTYFLVAWSIALDVITTGTHLPPQISVWHEYGASFGLPIDNLMNWTIAGLLLLSMSRLVWRTDLETQHLAIWLPFSMYTANIGFVMLLSFGSGLWFPFLLSTCLILVPESLAYFPREEPHPTHGGPWRASLSQAVWLIMRFGTWGVGKRHLRLNSEGVEHIPRSGPVLIAARHFHYFYDGYILVRAVPRRLHTIVALDWVQVQSLRLVIELACSLADWPVILRSEQLRVRDTSQNWAYKPLENRRYLRQMISATVRLLRSSKVLVIFPEGYPNIDPHSTPKAEQNDFLPFRPGFIRLVELAERDHQTRVAIVPAGLIYKRDSKGWQATVRFDQALFLQDFASPEEALHTVEKRVQSLSRARSSADLPPSGETFPF